jgi:hypothetical protein
MSERGSPHNNEQSINVGAFLLAKAYLDQMLLAIFRNPQVRRGGEDNLSNLTTDPMDGQDLEIPVLVPQTKQIKGGDVAV